MKPIEFKEQTIIIAEDQPQYENLPAFVEKGNMGRVISCWKLSPWERLKVLFTGRLWSSLCCFGGPVTPSFFTLDKPFDKREYRVHILTAKLKEKTIMVKTTVGGEVVDLVEKRFPGCVILAMDVQSIDEEDEAVPVKPNKPVRNPNVGRNSPCPCGSGKKFKRCCLDG